MSFLPGMFPGAAAAGAEEVLTELTQVGSGVDTDGDGSITSSVTIAAGDLLLLWEFSFGTTSAAFAPAFTNIVELINTATNKLRMSYKLATGSEGTSVTGGSAVGTTTIRNQLYVFRGNVPIVTITPADAAFENTSGNPAAQTVNASGGTPPLVVAGGYGTVLGGTLSPRTFTVGGSAAKDGEINAGNDYYLAYKIFNTSPADTVVDMDDEGAINRLASCYIACA